VWLVQDKERVWLVQDKERVWLVQKMSCVESCLVVEGEIGEWNKEVFKPIKLK
jgi:hypothetical protein